ncbi:MULTISPECIES: B12-binding domain-containing protein [Sporomusa]|jgi:5-methyltetrahydrofolate--homocysteine methyltransferase|uniref:cobalamin B12-binding domain-containing protein n=1 Tax=Sporomusa TaxID=2375 RepID=UPI0016691E52|nr:MULTISPECIES: corrinoid protein [Sporomusa]MCM0758194.1 corrinoid protein [Sporomusa sphaeroides DSM 2875]HML32863.1 corrinoid protein [Sporomusa sphaeroides]
MVLTKIREMVIEGEGEEAVALIKQAMQANISVRDIVSEGLIGAMNVVGPKMASGEMFVPEVLMCAEAMQEGLVYLKPFLKDGDVVSSGKFLIGTVKGDLHDIGKNLVAMMMESSGFEVFNIGIDQSTEAFLEAIEQHKPDIVGLSALLTTTMPAMRDTVNDIREKGIAVKIFVGGAPVSEEFAKEIGADAYCPDAAETVVLAKAMLA